MKSNQSSSTLRTLRRLHLALALVAPVLAFAGAPVCAAESTPATVAPALSTADADFEVYREASKPRRPDPSMTPLEREIDRENYWNIRREKALAFLARHPTDPRRWQIVSGLSYNLPRFVKAWETSDAGRRVKPQVDEVAVAEWRERVKSLRAAMRAATDVPEEVRKSIEMMRTLWETRQTFLTRWRSGPQAPDFAARRLDGTEIRLSEHRGKVVLLEFWATWCAPCLEGMPHLQETAARYKGQDVVTLALCTGDTRANFDRWVNQHASKYPDIVFVHDPAERGKERVANLAFGVVFIPAQLVIDRTGKVAQALMTNSGDSILDAALARAGVKVDPIIVARGEAALHWSETDLVFD